MNNADVHFLSRNYDFNAKSTVDTINPHQISGILAEVSTKLSAKDCNITGRKIIYRGKEEGFAAFVTKCQELLAVLAPNITPLVGKTDDISLIGGEYIAISIVFEPTQNKPSPKQAIENELSYYVPTSFESELEEKLKSQTDQIKKIAIFGITGSGKSVLAKHYYRRHNEKYQHKQILYAETQAQFLNSLEIFAEELSKGEGFSKHLDNITPEDKHAKTIEYIRGHLSEKSWIILIDNWDYSTSLSWPEIENIFNCGHGTLLLTTQHQPPFPEENSYLDLSRIPTNTEEKEKFTQEGIAILDKILMSQSSAELGTVHDKKLLVEYLNYLPLGLAQAAFYILWENKNREKRGSKEVFSYNDYCKLLSIEIDELIKKHHNLLKGKTAPKDSNSSIVDFRKIKVQEAAVKLSITKAVEGDHKSLEILCFCGFLTSDHISQSMLKNYLQASSANAAPLTDEEFYTTLDPAVNYSLLQYEFYNSAIDNFNSRSLHIHRVVQRVLNSCFWPLLRREELVNWQIHALDESNNTKSVRKLQEYRLYIDHYHNQSSIVRLSGKQMYHLNYLLVYICSLTSNSKDMCKYIEAADVLIKTNAVSLNELPFAESMLVDRVRSADRALNENPAKILERIRAAFNSVYSCLNSEEKLKYEPLGKGLINASSLVEAAELIVDSGIATGTFYLLQHAIPKLLELEEYKAVEEILKKVIQQFELKHSENFWNKKTYVLVQGFLAQTYMQQEQFEMAIVLYEKLFLLATCLDKESTEFIGYKLSYAQALLSNSVSRREGILKINSVSRHDDILRITEEILYILSPTYKENIENPHILRAMIIRAKIFEALGDLEKSKHLMAIINPYILENSPTINSDSAQQATSISINSKNVNEDIFMTLQIIKNNLPQYKEMYADSSILESIKNTEFNRFNDFPFYPNDYICGVFADLVYGDDCGESKLPFGWSLLVAVQDSATGYHGAAYWHRAHRQLVFASRGTNPSSSKDLLTDINQILRGNPGGQMSSARCFVVDVINSLLKIPNASNSRIIDSITLTGHSLGGWLAQVVGIHLEEIEVHSHIVVFESPGCGNMLDRLTPKIESTIDKYSLDITNYVAIPDVFNTCNEHVGTLYQIRFDINPLGNNRKDWESVQREAHNLDKLLETFDKNTGKPRRSQRMANWPTVSWPESKEASYLITSLFRLLNDYFKLDTSQVSIYSKATHTTASTDPTELVLDSTEEYMLQRAGNYLPAEDSEQQVVKLNSLPKAARDFLKRYYDNYKIFGDEFNNVLNKIASDYSHLPDLLNGKLELKQLAAQEGNVIIVGASPEILVNYLLQISRLQPEFFVQTFNVLEYMHQEAKKHQNSRVPSGILVGKAKNVTMEDFSFSAVKLPPNISAEILGIILTKAPELMAAGAAAFHKLPPLIGIVEQDFKSYRGSLNLLNFGDTPTSTTSKEKIIIDGQPLAPGDIAVEKVPESGFVINKALQEPVDDMLAKNTRLALHEDNEQITIAIINLPEQSERVKNQVNGYINEANKALRQQLNETELRLSYDDKKFTITGDSVQRHQFFSALKGYKNDKASIQIDEAENNVECRMS